MNNNNRIYLDYNATTPVDPEVLDAMMPYLNNCYGNPSSIHSFGNEAKAAIDIARASVSGMLNAKPSEIVFTSCGSESNNYAVKGVAYANRDKGNHLITTEVEHASSLETFRYLEKNGFSVTYIQVDENGNPDPEDFRKALTKDTTLISCMYVNNETGVISPIQSIAETARENGVIFHTDAIQAAGKIPIDLGKLPADLLSVSSHKIYGPKGAGALFIRKGTNITPFIHGGGQERGKRSGTENVAAIVGFGKAAELAGKKISEEMEKLGDLKARLYNGIKEQIKNIEVNGDIEKTVCNTLNLGFDGIHGESLVMNLDIEGVAASTGSACSEGNVDPSHVLMAMGQSREKAVCSLRFSIGRFTTGEEIDRVIQLLPVIESRIRNIRQKAAVRGIAGEKRSQNLQESST